MSAVIRIFNFINHQTVRQIRDCLFLVQASKERTTIIVAHRLSTIRGANKIVVISNGNVVEEGHHDELMAKRGEYYNLVTTQVSPHQFESDEKGK